MSKIGKRILQIPSGVSVTINEATIDVSGPNGKASIMIPASAKVIRDGEKLTTVALDDGQKRLTMAQGSLNSLLANALQGAAVGFTKILKIEGVGFKAAIKGSKLALSLGFSHPVELNIPQGIKVETPSATEVRVSGPSKEQVGQFAASVRLWRKPEPYNGKGIAYSNERIIRKVGKTAKGTKK